jgi:Holliday junction resolvase RusA-like endonuclease
MPEILKTYEDEQGRSLTFFLLGKPVPKGRPQFMRKTGIAFTPKKTVDGEEAVQRVALSAMLRTKMKAFQGPVEMSVLFIRKPTQSWPRYKRAAAMRGEMWPTSRPDFDNLIKLIADALNGLVYSDDSQIVRSFHEERFGAEDLTVVCVKPVTGYANPETYKEFEEWLKPDTTDLILTM